MDNENYEDHEDHEGHEGPEAKIYQFQLQAVPPDGSIRKLQVKAAVNKIEKERYERLAERLGVQLSILIRRELDRLAKEVGL